MTTAPINVLSGNGSNDENRLLVEIIGISLVFAITFYYRIHILL